MPTIHVFQAGRSDTLGYTHDSNGANLPRGIVRGTWKRLGTVDLGAGARRADAEVDLVTTALERDGFYVAVGGIDLTMVRPHQVRPRQS
jgi:hypothetical protein